MRTDTLALDEVSQNEASWVEEKIQLSKDITTMLRRNVVQARKVDQAGETWSANQVYMMGSF